MYQEATRQIQVEIDNGNYVPVNSPPRIISPIGVIPKPDGGVRLIHDCSRPAGSAVNDYAPAYEKQRFQSIDDAKKLVTPLCYMAKVDLKAAYRSVMISAHSQQVTGLKWTFDGRVQYLYDRKLPFGSKLAPSIFHRLSQAVARMMAKRGFSIVAYMDDFFLCESSYDRCQEAMLVLISLLRKLGFHISWPKVSGPCHTITFLGIEIDSCSMQLRLPEVKLSALRSELALFMQRKRATKRQLQSLAGKLNWAASVIYGGRVFLRNIINAVTLLAKTDHKAVLSGDLLRDILWWHTCMVYFNGVSIIVCDSNPQAVFTDACSEGGGGHWGEDWFYCNWSIDLPLVSSLHINEKEILAVTIAAERWAHLWENQRILIFSDNSATVCSINKGTSRNPFLMQCIRHMFWLSVVFNFRLTCRHIRGELNTRADLISRLHESGNFHRLCDGPGPSSLYYLPCHMSHAAFSSLSSRCPFRFEHGSHIGSHSSSLP